MFQFTFTHTHTTHNHWRVFVCMNESFWKLICLFVCLFVGLSVCWFASFGTDARTDTAYKQTNKHTRARTYQHTNRAPFEQTRQRRNTLCDKERKQASEQATRKQVTQSSKQKRTNKHRKQTNNKNEQTLQNCAFKEPCSEAGQSVSELCASQISSFFSIWTSFCASTLLLTHSDLAYACLSLSTHYHHILFNVSCVCLLI
jgi:cell division protein FtsI/penicillin-binding protein 2